MIDWAILPYVLLLAASMAVVARLHGAPGRAYLRGALSLLGSVAVVAGAAAAAFSTLLSSGCAEVVSGALLLLLAPVAAALVIGRVTGPLGRALSVGAAAVGYLAALVAAVIGAIDLGLVR